MDTPLDIPFTPVRVGSWYDQQRATVYGLAYDHSNTLIALSVLCNAVSAEQIHYKSQGQEFNFSMSAATGLGYARHCYSRKSHFKVFKNPIPDSSDVSMIMMNESLWKVNKDLQYTHVFYRSAEAFKAELWQRVKEIVYEPVLEAWAQFLVMKGMVTEVYRIPLCGRLTNLSESSTNWLSAGFDIGYISNNREAWKKLITDGLRDGKITVDGSVPTGKAAVSSEVTATLYIAGGETTTVKPKNGSKFTLSEVRELLGDRYMVVERMEFKDGLMLLCDDNARSVNEDYQIVNEDATKVFRSAYPPSRYAYADDIQNIVGNALLIKESDLVSF